MGRKRKNKSIPIMKGSIFDCQLIGISIFPIFYGYL